MLSRKNEVYFGFGCDFRCIVVLLVKFTGVSLFSVTLSREKWIEESSCGSKYGERQDCN